MLLVLAVPGASVQSSMTTNPNETSAVDYLQSTGLVGRTHIAPRGLAHVRQLKQLKLPEPAWLLASGEVVRRETTTS